MVANSYKSPGRRTRSQFLFPASSSVQQAQKLIVEIGPGRGDFLFHLASTNPDAIILAVEIKSLRVDKLVRRIQKRGMKNIILIQADGRDFLKTFSEKIHALYINFPDPWPKQRHRENRLMNPRFLSSINALLTPGGFFSFTTDDQTYATYTSRLLQNIAEFQSLEEKRMSTSAPDAFPTYFSEKWKAMGRTIYYQRYKKL